jgi:drug/metabolite transporter (DMT)-like permease
MSLLRLRLNAKINPTFVVKLNRMHRKNGLVYIALVLAMICWAFSFIWVKIAYHVYAPLTTTLFRLIIASLFMFVYALAFKKLTKIRPEDYRAFLLLAFFEPFLYFLGESYGLKYISSTMCAIIVATIPLFSPLAASRFHGEILSPRNLIGIILSFIGVGIVVFDSSFNLIALPLGIALEFLAVASAIGYQVILKSLTKKYNVPTIITYQNFIAIFYFLPCWLFFEFKDFINTPFDGTAFIAIVKLGVFASAIAFVLYTFSIKNVGINNANMFINLIPVLTAIFAWFILYDPLTVKKLTGIAVVISGLFIAQVKMKGLTAKLFSIQQDGGR